jgi:hypothetical protein
MKRFAAISFAAAAVACTSEEPAAPVQGSSLVPEEQVQPALPARAAFPERAANLTPAPEPRAKPQKPAAEPRPEPAPAAPPPPPRPPFAYVGKLADGNQRYAVLSRDQQVFVVRQGDSLAGRYRVEAVREEQVLLYSLDHRVVQPLAFTGPAGGPVGAISSTTFPGGGGDGVSLMIAAPNQVSIGEQFTLTVSLDSGMRDTLETGTVELRFDPKVLRISGSNAGAAAGGSARLEISGAYMGHPAPATVQFTVVAGGPTSTEVRVVPTNIADNEGRNVGVDAPPAHKLRVVRERQID